MIKYTLKCSQGHCFESWFQSSGAFGKLQKSGLVACSICGRTDIVKAIMAPRVRATRTGRSVVAGEHTQPGGMHALTAPSSPAEEAIRVLKDKIQKHSEYVGTELAREARAIHEGDAPERSIYGEAAPSEARKLIEDGVPITPLPFMPTRKTN